MAADFEVIPGWYGKVPFLGDFASRRLPQKFIATWDNWLQQSMVASRTQLGGHWLDAYLRSPIWRFVLMPGVIGDEFWVGLMMPSVDKVGRHFPLTIAVSIASRPGILATVIASGNWYAEIENTLLAALSTEFTVEQLETRLAGAPFQDGLYQEQDTRAVDLANWWAQPQPAANFAMALPVGCTAQHIACAAASEWLQSAGTGKSVWWHDMETSAPSRMACFSGLPPLDHYATFLHATQDIAMQSVQPLQSVKPVKPSPPGPAKPLVDPVQAMQERILSTTLPPI
jgi:type VI secretion system protein ImpM